MEEKVFDWLIEKNFAKSANRVPSNVSGSFRLADSMGGARVLELWILNSVILTNYFFQEDRFYQEKTGD